MVDLVFKNRNEQRVIEYVVVEPEKLVKVADPDEAKLKEYYEANKRAFMTPAYRKIALLLLTRDSVKGRIAITDEEVKAKYEETKASFNTPEKRRMQQVVVPRQGRGREGATPSCRRRNRSRGSRHQARLQGKRHRSRRRGAEPT